MGAPEGEENGLSRGMRALATLTNQETKIFQTLSFSDVAARRSSR